MRREETKGEVTMGRRRFNKERGLALRYVESEKVRGKEDCSQVFVLDHCGKRAHGEDNRLRRRLSSPNFFVPFPFPVHIDISFVQSFENFYLFLVGISLFLLMNRPPPPANRLLCYRYWAPKFPDEPMKDIFTNVNPFSRHLVAEDGQSGVEPCLPESDSERSHTSLGS